MTKYYEYKTKESKKDLLTKVDVLQNHLYKISTRNNKLQININNLSTENNKLSNRLHHSKDILNNSCIVADIIINSDLNCDWMDDRKEKLYLTSVIDFLGLVCSDTNYELFSDHKKSSCTLKHTKAALKKI